MKIWKRCQQILSVVLTVIMAVQIPIVAYGQSMNDEALSNDLSFIEPVLEEQIVEEAEILVEIEDSRDAYTKHFFTDNGSMIAVQYAVPVHFQNEEGKWIQYNNRMEETTDILDPTLERGITEEYKVIASDRDVRLAKKAGDKKIVTIAKGDNLISWGFVDVNKVSVEFTEAEKVGEGNETFLNLEGVIQEAWYRDAFENADLQYLVTPTGVKENIILKSADVQNEFVMEYKFKALSAKQIDAKTIELRDESDQVVYTITAPMMQDANGEWCHALTLSIIEQKDNKLKVKLSVDKEWLNDSKRSYPVVVDPSFETSQDIETVHSTTLVSGNPSTAYGKGSANYIGTLYVGYEPKSGFAKTRALVKLNSLPKLSPGDVVVGAKLQLLQYASSGAIQVDAHKVTSSWNMATATWNSAHNNYEGDVLDYDITTSEKTKVYNTWDITSLTRQWYSAPSNNYGVMLISPSETSTSSSRVIYYASTYPDSVTVRPVFQITYRNNKGLEGYWSYHEQSAGNGAVGYINDFSGNLVYQATLMSESGSRLPIAVTLTYNGYTSNQQFMDGSVGPVVGNGWQMNWNQRCWKVEQLPELGRSVVTALQNAGYKRIYIDGDGTVHYFKTTTDDNTLEDEDGLGMTMLMNTSTSSPYLIECSDGTELHFTAYGYLYKVVDTNNNTINVTYSGDKITKITDGAGRITTFSYATSGSYTYLQTVTDPSGRVTTLSYDPNGNLTIVAYPDGTTTQFEYSDVSIEQGTYYRISKVTAYDGTYLTYVYKPEATVTDATVTDATKVASVTEYASDGTQGNSLAITYNSDNTTVFQYTSSGKTTQETNIFDNYGRTTCIINADNSHVTATYSSTAGKTNNQLTHVGGGSAYINNKALNPSAERTGDKFIWTASASSGATFAADTTKAFLGSKSLKVACTSSNTTKYGYYQEISVTAGESYTFSAYVTTENVTASGTNGAGLYMTFYNSSGTAIGTVTGTGLTGTNEWQRVKVTGTAPSGATKVRVYCGLMSAKGTAWFDCMQFEIGDTMNDYNMLERSSFEGKGSWTGQTLGTGDGTNTTEQKFILTGTYGKNRGGYQIVPVNRTGTSFTMSATAKGASVPTGYDGRYFALDLGIYYEDGTTTWHVAQFNPDTTAVQRISSTVMVPASKANLKITQVAFYVIYYYNANKAYFDDCMLTFDETGTAYTYDSEGNVIGTRDNAGRTSTATYDSNGNVTNITDSNNNGINIDYTDENQIESIESVLLNNGSSIVYDNYGNVLVNRNGTLGTDGQVLTTHLYTMTSNGYSSNGNYLTSVTDERGYTTEHTIDDITGLITAITDARGNRVNYTYNSNSQQLQSISSGNSTVSFVYDSYKRLAGITHNGFQYGFTYDKFGNTSTIKVGNQTLLTNNYANGNGDLLRAIYGNNTIYSYGYDNYHRMTSIDINGTSAFTYKYNGNGALAEIFDVANARRTEYTYDVSGNLVRVLQPGYSDIRMYSQSDLQSQTVYSFGGQSKVFTLTQNADGLNSTATLISGLTVQKTYDSLNRETVYSIGNSLKRNISYLNVSGNRTTSIPSAVSYSNGNSTLFSTSYGYDEVGNITTMTVGGTTYTYTYDSLNQLKTVTTSNNSYSASYNYDNAGNITSKTINGVTYSYGYNNSNWKDLLTSYNGQTITYDAIGNPLFYRDNITMSWTGRQLNSMFTDTAEIAYLYNSDGIRTQKTVDGVTTQYFLDGSRILAEKTDSSVIWYIYDDTGDILGLIYNGTPYYYLKNMQGDVISIVDSNLNVVNGYTYDAWGKVTAITGSGTIGAINPIRYRGYYYDNETGFYYLNSRYYDPETGRFINADDTSFLGASGTVLGYNLFAYCENNPVNMIDIEGFAAINVIFAAVGAVAGVWLGDYVAKRLGYYSGWKYWAIRTGVVAGGAVIGWFAGSLLAKIIATYLKSNPAIVFKITNKLGATGFHYAMKFLGINPFLLSMDSSKFIAIARLFNTKVITISYDWAVQLYKRAKDLGFKITLDSPHNGYTWHIHISGNNGKLNNLHIQIVKKAWDYLAKLLR